MGLFLHFIVYCFIIGESKGKDMERAPNAEQRLVIEDLENNLIVFASAGTGKTFTVAKRVARIIKTERALPQERDQPTRYNLSIQGRRGA